MAKQASQPAPTELPAEEVTALQTVPPSGTPHPVGAASQDAFQVTLDEFCKRLSSADKRVEMIGAFHSDEQRHQRLKDSEAAYRARYDAFISRPTKD